MKTEDINRIIASYIKGWTDVDYAHDTLSMHYAISQLTTKHEEIFVAQLESVFLRDNPLWDGPYLLIGIEAHPWQLAEAFVKAIGQYEG